jgi:hypothetical protein
VRYFAASSIMASGVARFSFVPFWPASGPSRFLHLVLSQAAEGCPMYAMSCSFLKQHQHCCKNVQFSVKM